jgi:hypothetical protein
MEPKSSLLCTQESIIGPYPEPKATHSHPVSLISIYEGNSKRAIYWLFYSTKGTQEQIYYLFYVMT